MAKRSWKQNPVTVPRFLQRAIRKGLKMADSIGIEEMNDKSELTIRFRRWKDRPLAAPAERHEP